MKKILCLVLALSMLLAGCGKKNYEVKVGDVEVTSECIDYFENLLKQQMGGQSFSDTRDYVKENIVINYAQYIAVAKAMKLDTDKYKDEYKEQIKASKGDVDEFKKEQNMNDDTFKFFTDFVAAQKALEEQYKKDCNVDDAKIKEYFLANYLRAKHLLLLTDDKDDAGKAEVKTKIDGLYEQVKVGADFDKLIEEHNEDPGVKTNPNGYVFKDGEMVTEFYDGVKNIGIGEYNLVETTYGYHIVKRLAIDENEEIYKECLEEKQTEILEKLTGKSLDTYVKEKVQELNIETTDLKASVTPVPLDGDDK